MGTFASVFPLRWLASGMRAVFLPDQFEIIAEPGGDYQLAVGGGVLLAWVVVGLVAAIWTFEFGREQK